MPLSDRDRKILWARSGNLCAYPECTQPLVPEPTDASPVVVIGMEAHIIAKATSGPRGDAASPDHTESAANYILLCPTHHRVVDADAHAFPPELLRSIKQSHEARVRARMLALSDAAALGVERFALVCPGLVVAHAWQVYQTVLVVCSYGAPPLHSPSGYWTGSGLRFIQLGAPGEEYLLANSSEGDPDIEYWLAGGLLHIRKSTYDPVSGSFRPLVVYHFDLSRTPAGRSVEMLITPRHDVRPLAAVDTAIRAVPLRDGSMRELLFFELRDAGLREPLEAIALLTAYRAEPWYDGATAELGETLRRELIIVAGLAAAV